MACVRARNVWLLMLACYRAPKSTATNECNESMSPTTGQNNPKGSYSKPPKPYTGYRIHRKSPEASCSLNIYAAN